IRPHLLSGSQFRFQNWGKIGAMGRGRKTIKVSELTTRHRITSRRSDTSHMILTYTYLCVIPILWYTTNQSGTFWSLGPCRWWSYKLGMVLQSIAQWYARSVFRLLSNHQPSLVAP